LEFPLTDDKDPANVDSKGRQPLPCIVLAGFPIFQWEEIRNFEEDILNNSAATEVTASDFFDRFPKFLLMGHGHRLQREVVLVETGSGRKQRVDFFRQNHGTAFWDVIELKSPKFSAVSRPDGAHPRLSGTVYDAINQAQDYRDTIDSDPALRERLMTRGISVYRPEILIVAGRSDNLIDPIRMRELYDRIRSGPIEFRTYDDIHRFAVDHYRATKLMVLPASILLAQASRHKSRAPLYKVRIYDIRLRSSDTTMSGGEFADFVYKTAQAGREVLLFESSVTNGRCEVRLRLRCPSCGGRGIHRFGRALKERFPNIGTAEFARPRVYKNGAAPQSTMDGWVVS
jgi:Domain of unknown function (DUF4263)